jgi:deoxyribodipyrimidine photo-lyase
MAKRLCSGSLSPRKKTRLERPLSIGNVASPEAAAAADADPPLKKLLHTLDVTTVPPRSGDAIVYWMRMEDMRSLRFFLTVLFSPHHLFSFILASDNRALAQASAQAVKDHVPLLVLFVLSPQDFAAHDRSPRRIDFTLRNLCVLRVGLTLSIAFAARQLTEPRIPLRNLIFHSM